MENMLTDVKVLSVKIFNPLHLNIIVYILHTVLCTFPTF